MTAIDAEVRFVEEGHRCFVQEGGWIKVVSDTAHGKWFRVDFWTDRGSELVVSSCTPQGERAGESDHGRLVGQPGIPPCKHAAGAMRRLEREGLAEYVPGVGWRSTIGSEGEEDVSFERLDGDPFAGLT